MIYMPTDATNGDKLRAKAAEMRVYAHVMGDDAQVPVLATDLAKLLEIAAAVADAEDAKDAKPQPLIEIE